MRSAGTTSITLVTVAVFFTVLWLVRVITYLRQTFGAVL
jgi:hypothetical protein